MYQDDPEVKVACINAAVALITNPERVQDATLDAAEKYLVSMFEVYDDTEDNDMPEDDAE